MKPGDLITTTNGWNVALRSAGLLGRRMNWFVMYLGTNNNDHVVFDPLNGIVYLQNRSTFEIVVNLNSPDVRV